MEKISQRLDSVQEKQLKIYEKDSSKLSDLIEYWDCVEKENLILYAARGHGITKIGLTIVPVRHVSEERAKQAIQMKLTLQSLAASSYGGEPWHFSDVTLERYMVQPSYTLKKGPTTVDVLFDGDPENRNEYTGWQWIYAQYDGRWLKSRSYVTHAGIFFVDDEDRPVYYVRFRDDATLYSQSEYYEVYYNGRLVDLQNPVPLSSGIGGGGGGASPHSKRADSSSRSSSVPSPGSAAEGETSTPVKRRRLAFRSPAKEVPTVLSGTRSPKEVRRKSQPRTPSKRRGGRRARRSSPHVHGTGSGGRTQRKPAPGVPAGDRGLVPTAEEVGTRHETPKKGPKTRVEKLLAEAWDPPLVYLSGSINSLKAYRSRLKHLHTDTFTYVTSTFTVQYADVRKKLPLGRFIVFFENTVQRDFFIHKVKRPSSIKLVKGSINGNP